MHKFKQAVKNAWSEAGLSLPKLISAALAAITMALINPKISAVTNSVIAVGIVSMISALVGASYFTMATLTTKGAKKVTENIVPENNDETIETTIESPQDIQIQKIIDNAPAKAVTARQKRIKALIVYAAAFIVVSLLTISSSWAVAQATAAQNSRTSIIQIPQSHELSEEEIDDISDRAADKVDINIESPETTTVTPEIQAEKEIDPKIDLESLKAENEQLQIQIDELKIQLENQNNTPSQNLQELIDQINSLSVQLEDANARLSALESKLNENHQPTQPTTPGNATN